MTRRLFAAGILALAGILGTVHAGMAASGTHGTQTGKGSGIIWGSGVVWGNGIIWGDGVIWGTGVHPGN